MVEARFQWKHQRNMRDNARRLNQLQKEIGNSLLSAAEEIGLRVIADAVRKVRVDTGRLRASLESKAEEIGEHTVRVAMGSNVSYAEIIERRYPYLRPAIRENAKKIEEIAGKALRDAVEATS